MTSEAVIDLFRSSGALLEGHFRLTSGLHSTGYMQSALVLQYPRHAEALGRALAAAVGDRDIEAVLSPALAGAVAIGVAAIISRGKSVDLDVPFRALAQVRFPDYEPDTCPLCAQGLPAVKPGSWQA